ncbi:MAG: hypothetical protein IH591_13120, partial [Bacteroidales bacterium]|nr:hypothetical protein [Bacteroidales bacterium]
MQNLDETPPTEPGDETEQIPILPEDRTDLQPEEDKPRRQLGRLIGLGLLAVIILAALGSLG